MDEFADSNALIETALRLRMEGRWPEMVSLLRPVAGSDGADARVCALLAEAWLLAGRDAEAEAALTPALAQEHDNDLVYAAKSRLKLRQGDRPGAEAAAALALRLRPAEPDHRLLVASLIGAAGRTEEALGLVEQILAEHPDLAAAHARRAILLLALRRTEEALASARAADAAGFRHPDAWRLYFSVGDRAAAIEALGRRLAIDPSDSAAMISLGEMLRGAGRTEEALGWLTKAVEARPEDARAWAGYGTALQASSMAEEARAAYRRSLALAPGADVVHLNLAAMEHQAGRYEAVLQALQPIVDAGRGNPPIYVAVGKAASRLGRRGEAIQAYQAALALEPANTEALRALGRTSAEAAVFASRAEAGLLTLDSLLDWLQLLASEPSLGDALAQFDRFSAAVRPNPRELARLSTYPLVARWALGDMTAVQRLLAHKGSLQVKEIADEQPHRFFHYVERLAAFRAVRPELYEAGPAPDEVQVIGESHALSPANLLGRWRGRPVRFRSRFIMGVKMFGLASPASAFYGAHLDAHLCAIAEGADLLFTIGEIDCRPDEGIWPVHRRSGRAVADLAEDTVGPYLEALAGRLKDRSSGSVTIQGVPSPAYDFTAKLAAGERPEDFLQVIREVNLRLEEGARARGWGYLDTWAATAKADGASNRLWHIDGYHLSPGFYTEAADLARRS